MDQIDDTTGGYARQVQEAARPLLDLMQRWQAEHAQMPIAWVRLAAEGAPDGLTLVFRSGSLPPDGIILVFRSAPVSDD